MAISRVKVWVAGDILTAADLNAEFNNVLNNALALVSPLTGTLNVNNQQLTNMVLELQAATQTASVKGREYYQTTEQTIHLDTGTVIGRVPVLQGVQAGDIPMASPFYDANGATSGATQFVSLRVASAFQIVRSSNATPPLPAFVNLIAGAGIGLTNNAGDVTLTAGGALALAGSLSGSAGGSYTTTSASYSDMDATNLKVTVTIPTGAKFLIVAYTATVASSGGDSTSGNHLQVLAAGSAVAGASNNNAINHSPGNQTFTGYGVVANPTAGSQTIALQFKSDGGNTLTVTNPAFEAANSTVPRLLYLVTN